MRYNSGGHVYTYVKDNNDEYALTMDGETFLSEEAVVELEKRNGLKQTKSSAAIRHRLRIISN